MTNVHQHALVKGISFEALILTCADCGFCEVVHVVILHGQMSTFVNCLLPWGAYLPGAQKTEKP